MPSIKNRVIQGIYELITPIVLHFAIKGSYADDWSEPAIKWKLPEWAKYWDDPDHGNQGVYEYVKTINPTHEQMKEWLLANRALRYRATYMNTVNYPRNMPK